MYLIECANAYLAAVQLQQKEMDYQTAFAVMMVKKQLQSHVEFLQNEELKLAEKYGEKDERAISNGRSGAPSLIGTQTRRRDTRGNAGRWA